MNQLLDALKRQNPQLPDLLLEPLFSYLLSAREAGDLDLNIILLVIAIRTVEHPESARMSVQERGDVPVFPSLGVNINSIAESSGIPRETVRRKVDSLVRIGWVARQGSTLHCTSKCFRETTFLREAFERLAVENFQIIGKEASKLPPT
jgi:hypothetical protein